MGLKIIRLLDRENDMASYKFRINGFARSVESPDPDKPLLYVLRGLGLTGTKFGCGLGQCGACTVLIDGQAARSCQTPIADVQGKSVTTLEGLGSGSAPHPIQAAFIKEQVPQCGYCTSGMIMSAAALLAEKEKPTEDEIRAALDGNLCRCGTHVRVIRAVMAASGQGG
jgi:nicotinate dehydrogenase subunit A